MPRSNDRSFNKPIIFLAFAQDRQDSVYYLRNLPEEFRQVRAALQQKMEPDSAALTWQSINALLAPDTMKAAFAERWFSPALNFHNGAINSVAFSPDGKTLASGSDDQTIRLWDLYLYFVVFLKDGKPTQLFLPLPKGQSFSGKLNRKG